MTYYQFANGEVHDLSFEPTSDPIYAPAKKLTNAAGKLARKQYAAAELRKMIKPGQTVYCVLRSVSSSGMSRRISLQIVDGTEIRNIDSLAADAAGFTLDKNEGIRVSGCGMDMGFHLVYSLGMNLWPNGTETPHGTRNGKPDSDGGYALKSSWL